MGFICDRLYGKIEYDANQLKLFQTREMARLRHVSLSAIPTWTIPTGVCASKFEHSIGVAHLATIVGSKAEFQDIARDLYFAALAHDLGTPPFSHTSEYFQVKLTGKNHEKFVEEIIEGGEFAKEVRRQGGDIKRIIELIKGENKPVSDIVNGTIDIDNLDNTLRYGVSVGLLDELMYSPEELAKAFAIKEGELVLLADHIGGLAAWERVRQSVYEFVYGIYNLSAGTILFRALDFARRDGEISRDYFLMTDAEALHFLLTKCNKRTRTLMERADKWIFYPRVFNLREVNISEELANNLLDSDNRGLLADEISKKLKIPPEDVSVYMGKDKGFKKIHLPIVGESGDRVHEPQSDLTYMVQVFVHPNWTTRSAEVAEVVNEYLS